MPFIWAAFSKAVAELGLEQAVDALRLLLFAKLETVAYDFSFAILAMLPRYEVALFNGALLAVAALAFQK